MDNPSLDSVWLVEKQWFTVAPVIIPGAAIFHSFNINPFGERAGLFHRSFQLFLNVAAVASVSSEAATQAQDNHRNGSGFWYADCCERYIIELKFSCDTR